MLWLMFWLYFGASQPADSSFVSSNERLYIERCLAENITIETRRKVWSHSLSTQNKL